MSAVLVRSRPVRWLRAVPRAIAGVAIGVLLLGLVMLLDWAGEDYRAVYRELWSDE